MKRNMKHIYLTSVLALSAFSYMNMAASAEETGFAVCEEGYLNVRTEATVESEVIGKLYHNGRVEILDSSADGAWYHIRSGNVDGYVSADYIATGSAAQEAQENAGYTTAEVGAAVLNVRASKDTDSEIIGVLYENHEYEVVDDQGDWIKVVTDDGIYGWVSAEYVYVSTEYGMAETLEEEQARLDQAWLDYLASESQEASDDLSWEYAQEAQAAADRAAETAYEARQEADAAWQEYVAMQEAADSSSAEGANTTQQDAQEAYNAYEQAQTAADAADTAYEEAQATADAVYEESQSTVDETGASAVSSTENANGSTASTTSETNSSYSPSSASSTGQAIANYACQFVGNPYVYGGTSLTGGADCSGFVMSVFANFGISLPHEAAAQSGYGTAVDASSLQPGDLVFYSNGSGISHVAIYIGNGSIVHAANESSGICYGSLNYNTPVAYSRLV